ncbi:MAG: haloacid dehalogenase [Chloroflexi bacterium]|nr:haloacid dehalogenase [Chloroflexota bacterium]
MVLALEKNLPNAVAAFVRAKYSTGRDAVQISGGFDTRALSSYDSEGLKGELVEALEIISDKVRQNFQAKNSARDAALAVSRELIRLCALSIRATHRAEVTDAAALLTQARALAAQMKRHVAAYPDLYFTGYVQDALKELAEAHLVHAIINDQPLPDPDALGVDYAAYLNGLGEAAGELRRYALDIIRHGNSERCEKILGVMDDIYSLLVTVDFPDAITGGLRRTTDMVRGVLERTRGDLTVAARQEKLERTLREFEDRVKPRSN